MKAERGTGAMVSRSLDGQMIIPALKLAGVVPVRGSGGKGRGTGRGGREALEELIDYVKQGHPAYLAVDGPRGPRGHVHKGVAVMAKLSNAAVLLMVAIPERRWILSRTWDRLQIPKPFTRINGYFSEPMCRLSDETAEQFRIRLETRLAEMEQAYDPAEASYNKVNSTLNAAPAA